MLRKLSILSAVAATALVLLLAAPLYSQSEAKAKKKKSSPFDQPTGYTDTPVLPGQKWRVHDDTRPRPKVVDPGTFSSQSQPGKPPSDAIVLFDGKDLSKWRTKAKDRNGGGWSDAKWLVKDGYFQPVKEAGDLISRESFGDAQYHVEWSAPTGITGNSQLRGNSGFIIMSRYEIQILDSWNNKTYADGQAGAIYGQWPPFVNAVRKPGEWNIYDIAFEAPKFENGKLVKPPYATVFLNGVLLHNRQEIIGPMAHRIVRPFEAHGPEEPLLLQDHGDPVRYRNIWVRRIKGYDQPE